MEERYPITHELKTWPDQFDAVAHGEKTFEIRKNDRDYRVGDFLHLNSWDPKEELYTGSSMTVLIVGITMPEDLKEWIDLGGFVILSIATSWGE